MGSRWRTNRLDAYGTVKIHAGSALGTRVGPPTLREVKIPLPCTTMKHTYLRTHAFLPFEYHGLLKAALHEHAFEDVVWQDACGPFVRGDKVAYMAIDYSTGVVLCSTNNGSGELIDFHLKDWLQSK